MNAEIITGEMFGCPIDFEKKIELTPDGFKMTISWRNPHLEYDAASKTLKVFPPPRMPKPLSDRELTEMRLAGWIV